MQLRQKRGAYFLLGHCVCTVYNCTVTVYISVVVMGLRTVISILLLLLLSVLQQFTLDSLKC